VLHQKPAVFSGNRCTKDFFRGVLLAGRTEHIDLSGSLLDVYDTFGISLPFETPGTQYRK
jgi:hypothetical protein